MRVLCLTLTAALLTAGHGAAEEDTRSLAERAEAAAAKNSNKKKSGHDRVLTNEDLKKAKGNVIFLTATPAPADGAAAPAPAAPSMAPALADPSVPGASISTVAIVDQRQRAARLRGSIEEAQRQLAVATAEQRPALEQRLNDALDELARTHEAIGALTERARQGGNAVPSSH